MSAATPFATNFSMLARAARPGVGRAADAQLLVPAQGIQCGALSLAFPYAWARAIIEDFSLTPVPNAPAWLVGAANVEGEGVAKLPPRHLGLVRETNPLIAGNTHQKMH